MNHEKAMLAGGCFWGMEALFQSLPGVQTTRVGYSGGHFENPTYENIKTGKTNHAETIEVVFDPSKISYEQLLAFFFQIHDPSTKNRQGNDLGTQYRSIIFYLNEEQKEIAEKHIARINASGKWPGPIVTEILPASTFYEAEAYHQKYLQRQPNGYTCHFIRPDWVL